MEYYKEAIGLSIVSAGIGIWMGFLKKDRETILESYRNTLVATIFLLGGWNLINLFFDTEFIRLFSNWKVQGIAMFIMNTTDISVRLLRKLPISIDPKLEKEREINELLNEQIIAINECDDEKVEEIREQMFKLELSKKQTKLFSFKQSESHGLIFFK